MKKKDNIIKIFNDKILSLNKKISTKFAYIKFDKNLKNLFNICKNYHFASTTTEYNISEFIKSYKSIYYNKVEGSFVECGVWKGIYLVLFQKLNEIHNLNNRKIYGYDTFEGTPKPLEKNKAYNVTSDGKSLADEYEEKKLNEILSGWNVASAEEVKKNFVENSISYENLNLVKGKVETTLNDTKNLPDQIAILKIDTCFYESYKIIFENLAPKVSKNGIIIVDNYFTYKGPKQATDDYLDNKKLNVKFNKLSRNATIYL